MIIFPMLGMDAEPEASFMRNDGSSAPPTRVLDLYQDLTRADGHRGILRRCLALLVRPTKNVIEDPHVALSASVQH